MKSAVIRRCRRGQALLEFAIIAFVMSAMVAGLVGLIVLGLGSFQNNLAAENAGRLLDENEHFSADAFNELGLDASTADAEDVYRLLTSDVTSPSDPDAGPKLFDESKLILTPAEWFDASLKASLPPLNRYLLASYIYDPDRDVHRYPGAVVSGSSGETVMVPLLATSMSSKGIDNSLHIDPATAYPVSDDWVGPVTVQQRSGVFEIVITYPSQPAAMMSIDLIEDVDGNIVSQTPVIADDSSLSLSAPPTGYTLSPILVADGSAASPSRGDYGLGEDYAFGTKVRPYRRIFESMSVFRLP